MKRVLLLGSTGSIGRTTLSVLEEMRESHQLVGLAAGSNVAALVAQAQRWRPSTVAIADPSKAAELRAALPSSTEVLAGPDSAAELVRSVDCDVVVSGISGAAGLGASLAAARRGVDLALANKESMVVAGPILSQEAARSGSRILPVDSEHSAIFQCLAGQPNHAVRRLILTASGGPFRTRSREEMERATPEQALAHPTWKMGAKISIDSATLMNKALEVVEARWLFEVEADRISALVHPQSIVHSMVEFVDGSILAQLGLPDMAVPIRYALAYPERAQTESSYFEMERFANLTFEEPDLDRFPGLRLGFEAARTGGIAGAVLNAANEVAVADFLSGRISFPQISRMVEETMQRMVPIADPTLEQVLEADGWAREEAARCR